MWRAFTCAVRELWRLSLPGEGAYRPDLHYMRGPGPKWQAKYGTLYPKPPAPPASSAAAAHDFAERRA